jgi:hypothetical protein
MYIAMSKNDLFNLYELDWYNLERKELLLKMSLESDKKEILKKIENRCNEKREKETGKLELTAFVMCLNHKIWYWYEKNDDLAWLYDKLWKKFDSKIEKKLK